MPWARVDDDFEGHPKVQALLNDERGAAAIGLWTLCLSWAHKYTRKPGKTPGLLPPNLPRRYLGPVGLELAGLLVKEGFWDAAGDEGWMIHDFVEYLPSEEMSRARAEAGRKGGLAKAANKAKLASSQEDVASSQEVLARDLANRKQTSSKGMGTGIGSSNSTEVVRGARRGSRIPEDFAATPEMVAWARANVPKVDGRWETQKFKDHWAAASGSNSVKRDWVRAWQVWMRNAAERNGSGPVQGALPVDSGVPEHMLRR